MAEPPSPAVPPDAVSPLQIRPDRVVHEPGRLAVLVVLNAVDEADFVFLLDQTGMTKGNLSSHTAKLEAAGYIEIDTTIVGTTTRTVHRLTAAGSTALPAYRDHMARVLQPL
jgi:DNA-binding MarR family transcriptional regulator